MARIRRAIPSHYQREKSCLSAMADAPGCDSRGVKDEINR